MPEKELWEYHRKLTDKRFDEVNHKLDKLNRFMWVFIGISIALSKFGSRISDIAAAFAGGK